MDQGMGYTRNSVTVGTGQLSAFTYEWEIDNYNLYSKKYMIKSPEFFTQSVPWCLEMYRNGKDLNSNTYVSLYLRVTDPNMQIKARFVLSLVDSKQQIVAMIDSNNVYDFNNNAWGIRYFVNKSLLYLATKHVNLKIMCQIMKEKALSYKLYMSSQMSLKKFDVFMNNEKFSDVIFTVENKNIFAHKIVLSTQSRVFAAMFEHEMKENNDNIVYIEDTSYDVFYELLRYVYTGDINVNENFVSELLCVSEKYELSNLREVCEKKLIQNLSVENALTCLELADMHNANCLKKEAMNFIVSHAEKIIQTTDFESLRNFHADLFKEVFQAVVSRSKQ